MLGEKRSKNNIAGSVAGSGDVRERRASALGRWKTKWQGRMVPDHAWDQKLDIKDLDLIQLDIKCY